VKQSNRKTLFASSLTHDAEASWNAFRASVYLVADSVRASQVRGSSAVTEPLTQEIATFGLADIRSTFTQTLPFSKFGGVRKPSRLFKGGITN
jgi:hypothetical protein